jgi:quinolinate synthase
MIDQVEIKQVSADIFRLKKERNAVILAHLYQRPEVQEIADFVGDSLELSRQAASTDAAVIVFCGVHFMAETAFILSPDKIVLLPDEQAGCPMANMITADELRNRKSQLLDAVVVAYVNTSAEVKAESDLCCTSANAVKVVQSVPDGKPIIFVPDRNLGSYIIQQTGRPMDLWQGWCNTHEWVTADNIVEAKAEHPHALVLAHPECQPEVVALADFVSGTSRLIQYVKESEASQFIIVTEAGILHQLTKHCPDKQFYLATSKLVCPNMKLTTLPKVKQALESLQPRITVPEAVRVKALGCLERMLAIK